jgi:hypothetical protein
MTESDFPLPDLVRLEDYHGDWNSYIEGVYQYFRQDFIQSSPSWPGRRWSLKRAPIRDGKEATFWHIVQEGGKRGRPHTRPAPL